ncbi:hypothetical protein COT97_00405 [Candidatus Falkowbacteria bacterium CG10_big_fil_rev_8_21_14_0_10_39_11]|uniref:Uncharacterized protein n=1 Tax=Candidatus Falkowbacteria bacterium CG10_big_fil_rev_8_21_14_0_10_39_11 TaxID=1974565 RepID=A0A2H0V897_9BACT|nr:MAG: hypothetical protein COT97_00405 [Candidatus Falkowbacteria bacterium CG10_big_fil_rev_8_21_14_0_10_39_11]
MSKEKCEPGRFFRVTDDFWRDLLSRQMKFHQGVDGFDIAEIFSARDRRLVFMVPRLSSDIGAIDMKLVQSIVSSPSQCQDFDRIPFSVQILKTVGLVYFVQMTVDDLKVAVLIAVPYSKYSQEYDGYIGFIKLDKVKWSDVGKIEFDSDDHSMVYRDYVSGDMEICLMVKKEHKDTRISLSPSISMSTDGRRFIRVS